MPFDLDGWQWIALGLATFLMGLSKTGVVGIGPLAVGIFALILPARESVGIVLLLLISADLVAVTAYRRHAVWSHVWRLFPWAAAGIVIGYAALGRIDDRQVATLVGAILLVLGVLQWWRQRGADRSPNDERTQTSAPLWFVAGVGIMAGFTTMVANAAGPIMTLYLLAMRLPKMEFVGTAAWYFLILNLFKVPFSVNLGLIDSAAVLFDLRLAPLAALGALSGRALIRHINQALFEKLALVFTLVAALRLLL